MSDEAQEVRIARLEERLIASDKALIIARDVSAARETAAVANATANTSRIISIISILITIGLALFRILK